MQMDATSGESSSKAPNARSPYRPEIDGLRALAVVAVIINHFNKDLLPSGYLGVDIFFVISGYVITSSLANHRSESFGDFFQGFYARRVKRMVPALVVFVLAMFLISSLFIPPESQHWTSTPICEQASHHSSDCPISIFSNNPQIILLRQ